MKISPLNILVLGGDGFVGSHLVDQALRGGHHVSVFDRFPYRQPRNLKHVMDRLDLFSGEFADRAALEKALKGQDVVYNFICGTNPATSWNDPTLEIGLNLSPTLQFLELATQAGVKKVVFPSSGGTIYGSQNGLVSEATLPKPFNPYGIAKLTVEHFLKYFQVKSGLAYDVYRIANAYGPRQPTGSAQGVISAWMHAILTDAEVQVYGNETTIRDYVYVGDITYLMLHALRDLTTSDTYNIGTGVGTSTLELLHLFQTHIDRPFRFRVHPRRPSDNTSIVLDHQKLMTFFPDFVFASLADKLGETWAYYQQSAAI